MIELPSKFYSSRHGAAVRAIVLHTTQGTDSRTWLTETGNVSSHYLVRESDVYRLVSEDDAAWHAGSVVGDPTTPLYDGTNPNLWTIGIEIEGYAAQPLSAEAIASTAALIRDIWQRRGALPLVAHAHLSPGNRSDPGVANFAALVEATKEQELTFKDDADAQVYVQNVRESFEAVKAVLAEQAAKIAALESARTRFIPHAHKTDGGTVAL